ncbi:MAG: MobV family relaxase [Clostridium butyricum]
MANFSKATKGSSGNLFDHYERKEGIKFKNQEIDKTKSYLNYNLAPSKNLSQREILNQRLSEVKLLKRNDVNIICTWIITLPKTIKKDSEEEKLFFKESYNFLKNKYKEKNIVSSYVHKDEVTPHMHFCFIPVVIDKKKNIEKVSAKECITREDLKKFHKELNDYMINIFNRDIGILNGATVNGNKTILEMKNQKLEEEYNLKKEIYKEIENLYINLDLKNIDIKKLEKQKNSFLIELEKINSNFFNKVKDKLINQEKPKIEKNIKDINKSINKSIFQKTDIQNKIREKQELLKQNKEKIKIKDKIEMKKKQL